MRTRVYYRGPDAVVTSELFIWRTAPAKTFVIRELRHVGIVRSDVEHLRSDTAHVAGGSLIVVAAAWPMLRTPGLVALGVIVFAVPGVVAAACWRMRPRAWELCGMYRGMDVVLYVSTDVRVLNQVSRALQRAMEDAHLHHRWENDDAA
jgi:hypothetical protein